MKRKQNRGMDWEEVRNVVRFLVIVALVIAMVFYNSNSRDFNSKKSLVCTSAGLQYFNGTNYCVLIENNIAVTKYAIETVNGTKLINKIPIQPIK